ncbi:hypothetical protein L0222_00590 [bacterium]|nr:hypothetical protein [bacterium]
MWSSITVTGSPRIMVVDATGNIQGWEHEFSGRLYHSLQRSGLQMVGNTPLRARDPQEIILNDAFNCMILFVHEQLKLFWNVLCRQSAVAPFLLALCTCESFDPQVSEDVLKSTPTVAPLAIAPLSSMSSREAGLFYLKFFTELKLHSKESVSGKMVWFSFSKARELLRRRRYVAKFGVRC